MPPNNHREKYFAKLFSGFIAVTAGIFSIVYACFEKTKTTDWYFWAGIASILICTGLYFLTSAVVHKVKSDLIRRQKMKEQHRTFTADSV